MTLSAESLNEAGIDAYNDDNYAEAFTQFHASASTGDAAVSISWPACTTRARA